MATISFVSNLAYATAYARMGWPVHPVHWIKDDGRCSCRDVACAHPGKHPLTAHGKDDATTDEATIESWWNRWPDANVAVHLAGAGLAAIDVDPRNGGALEALPEALDTLTARTGGAGWHLVVSVRKGAKLPARLGRGIDIKHDGYILVEPSNHASGGRYAWQDWEPGDEAPTIAAAPAWLLNASRTRQEGAQGDGASEGTNAPLDVAAAVREILTGEAYHDNLARLAASFIAKGMKQPDAIAVLRGLMAAGENRDERWRARYDAIPKAVESAFAKFSPHADAPARKPLDILREHPVPSFTKDCVPDAIWRLADAFSVATGFDRNGAVMAATVAAAAMIDDRLRLAVRPGSEWFESARLWAVLIGPPSAGKTPTLRIATDPIKTLHGDLVKKWIDANPDPEAKDCPPRPALYTSDATIEKLSEMLKDNPRGMLMLTEEFASWIGSIDAYRDGAGPKNRGEWLQLYDGGAHQVDRVKRGSFLVPNWSCSVLAAATPAGLRTHLRQLPDDGLIHRFMPVILQRPGAEANDKSASGAALNWSVLLREIHESSTRTVGSKANRISTNATMLFDSARSEIRQSIDAIAEVSPALASHVGKHPGMIARVAHTFHVLDKRQGDAIEADTMRQALAFMRVIRAHAAALYLGILGQSPALELARAVARTILAGKFTDVGRHTFTQHCRAWRSALEHDQRQAVQLLADADWLTPDKSSRAYGGWTASRWTVDTNVHERFAEHGQQHRDRRAAIKAAIVGLEAEA